MSDCESREAKSIDLEVKKVSDTEYIATVDKYTFKIRTRTFEDSDTAETIGVRFFEVNDQIEGLGTVGYRNLAVEDFTAEWIRKFINKSLATHTNFFKELSSSV